MPRLSPFRPLLRLAPSSSTATAATVTPIASTSYATLPLLHRAVSSPTPLASSAIRSRPTQPSLLGSSSVLSLLSAQSTSMGAAAAQQTRCVTYGSEYQPSQRIRKRRHGFLARNKTRNGRKTIMRRRFRGKAKLSH